MKPEDCIGVLQIISIKEAASAFGDRRLREAVKNGELVPIGLRPYTFFVKDLIAFAERVQSQNVEIVRARERVTIVRAPVGRR